MSIKRLVVPALLVAASAICMAITPVSAQCSYENPSGPGNAFCSGSCRAGPPPDNELQFCKKPLLQGGCTFTGTGVTPIILFPKPSRIEIVSFGLTRVGLGSMSEFWAVDAEYAGALISWPSMEMENQGLWGSRTTDTIPAASGAGFLFKILTHQDPTLRELEIGSISIDIPSFVLGA